MVFIYALKLNNDKYYIGKTINPSFRIESHFNTEGSSWTKKYKPIQVLEIIPNCDNFDEDKYTIKYMEKYGITNVRGGSFCEIRLTESNILTLTQMIKSSSDKCFICGLSGHYAKECKNYKSDIKIPTINLNDKCDCVTSSFSPHRKGKCLLNKVLTYFDDEDEDIDKITKLFTKTLEPLKENSCFRCGRNCHYINDCYAKTDINGTHLDEVSDEEVSDEELSDEELWCCEYCDNEYDSPDKCLKHEKYCKNKKNYCYKCLRTGHYAYQCYAKTNKYGNYLEKDDDEY